MKFITDHAFISKGKIHFYENAQPHGVPDNALPGEYMSIISFETYCGTAVLQRDYSCNSHKEHMDKITPTDEQLMDMPICKICLKVVDELPKTNQRLLENQGILI